MNNIKIVTRFAPSPTGFLHIGGARTALFNWLYSKATNGKFLLRIEDTDKARSTKAAVDAIINGLKWLGLTWDGDIVFQSTRYERHKQVAEKLLDLGHAYYCYLTPEEISKFRSEYPNTKIKSPWRNKNYPVPLGIKPTIRLKIQTDGETVLTDSVQGEIKVKNTELDDMVLLRSDLTPTYMLAVAVDDYDMGVNTVIRGDDHLTNTFRQLQIYYALDWQLPQYSHIPLIHSADGAKLSKRYGAIGVESYRDMGYLPEALCNYLLRLGWSKGNIDIIDMNNAAQIFSLSDISKSPAKFDLEKLNSINAHYINASSDKELLEKIMPQLAINEAKSMQETQSKNTFIKKRVLQGMRQIKLRAKTLVELAKMASIYITRQEPVDSKSQEVLDKCNFSAVEMLIQNLREIEVWNFINIQNTCEEFAQKNNLKPSVVMQYLRACVLGTFSSPGIYEVLEVLGKEEVIARFQATKDNLS